MTPAKLLLLARIAVGNLDPDSLPPGMRYLFVDIVVKNIHELPAVLQNILPSIKEPFVIAGKYAAYMLGLFERCEAVYIFAIGGPPEVNVLAERLSDVNGLSLFHGPVKNHSLAISSQDNNFMIFVSFQDVKKHEKHLYRANHIAMAQTIIDCAYASVLKCFGVIFQNQMVFARVGGPMFIPGEQDIANQIVTSQHSIPSLLCTNCTHLFWQQVDEN